MQRHPRLFGRSMEARVRYIMGAAYSGRVVVTSVPRRIMAEKEVSDGFVNYRDELLFHLQRCDPRLGLGSVLYLFGDVSRALPVPMFTKSRPIGARNNVLMNIDQERHWGHLRTVAEHDVPWGSKRDAAVWRGSSTGAWTRARGRLALVARHGGSALPLDVGLSHLVQGRPESEFGGYVKGWIPVSEQLGYKYIISVEGNDVASNLKWALFSRSVVIMAKPRMESWLLEGKLKAGVHYVEVKRDYSNLAEVVAWCMKNEPQCRRISRNATRYVSRFLDSDREREVACRVVDRYVRNVTIPATGAARGP
jgi:hypothetical protein